jgi:large subunit ribosomal protein L16
MFLSNNLIKQNRKDNTKSSQKAQTCKVGNLYLFSKQNGKISMDQSQVVRLFLRKFLKKQTKLWSLLLSFHNVTKKPNETRLGKGKGKVRYKTTSVVSGKSLIFFKLSKIDNNIIEIIKKSKYLISVRTDLRLKNKRWIL